MNVRRLFAAAVSLSALATTVAAQESAQATNAKWDPNAILRTESYVRPPADLERMLLAKRTDISFNMANPDRSWFLRTVNNNRNDILQRGKEHVLLGGLQVDTKALRARTITTSNSIGLVIVNPRTGAEKSIDTPKGASITAPTWSPDGKMIAYIANFDDASYVYTADPASGKAAQLSRSPLQPTQYTDLDFTTDSKNVIVVLRPDGQGAAPKHGPNGIEDGPTVRLTDSRAVPQPVHASLLLDPHDKAMLKYYATVQLATIDVKTKAVKKIGTPKMIRDVSASTDGQYFSVTLLAEPFSYLVPVNNFGTVRELWDASGKVITTLAKTPVREERGGGGGDDPPAFGGGGPTASDTGKRSIEWNPVGPGLTYLESVFAPANAQGNTGRGGNRPGAAGPGANRGGAPARPTPTSVRFMSWAPPFGPTDTKLIYEGGPQLGATVFSADGKMLFASDSQTVFAVRLADGKRFNLGRGVTLTRGGGGGFGGGGGAGANRPDSLNGGAIQTRTLPGGRTLVTVSSEGKYVAATGNRTPGANWSTQGPRPWVDKIEIESAQRTRVFDAAADMYENFVTALDDNYSQFLYTRESATTMPDVWLKDVAANTTKKITNNVDVGPQVSGAQVKRFQVTRPRDGHSMWVEVTLPKDWRPGQRMPGIVWFYPREYTQQADYERTKYTTNINRFPEVPSSRPASSVKLWVSQGYALIEPDIPIWGDSGRMNDNYTRDLRENLDAVVDAAVDAGYVDRDHLGIGGHSYGAFSTVNALTLVPYFKAGIAGDGMYNRSLTPFGFQSERRNFYQAQDTYLDMSPFFRADKISGALLMYHSWEDQNTGTSPISSTRMMAALQGLGKPAALYMYPYEDHSFAALQSDLDLWARWVAWMDIYVKGSGKTAKPVP